MDTSWIKKYTVGVDPAAEQNETTEDAPVKEEGTPTMRDRMLGSLHGRAEGYVWLMYRDTWLDRSAELADNLFTTAPYVGGVEVVTIKRDHLLASAQYAEIRLLNGEGFVLLSRDVARHLGLM